jgi:hypothetical protein
LYAAKGKVSQCKDRLSLPHLQIYQGLLWAIKPVISQL